MQFISYVVTTLITLYVALLILRIWMQWVRADFYNPFAQWVVKLTQPVIKPLRRIIPSIGSLDTASFILAWALTLLSKVLELYFASNTWMFSTVLIPLSLVWFLISVGTLLFWVLLIRAIMSWVSRGQNPVDYMLYQLTEPVLSPIRRLLPSMGMIDLAPMVVIFILYALNYLSYDVMGWILRAFS